MNKENNIINAIEYGLALAINSVIERETIVAEYFICQGDYKVGENLYLDLIILANDLYQIWGKDYDRERLDKYKEQISEFYDQRPIDIDIESLDPSERKDKIGIEADNIVWANNGQWIDLTNELYLMRKQYEIQAAIKLAGKNFLEAKKIYQRIIEINEDLIKYIDDPEDKFEKSKNLRDMGQINEYLGNKEEAEENFSDATKILENTFDEDMEISINYNLAKAYYDQAEFFRARNNFDQAIAYAKKGMEICHKSKEESYKKALNPILIDLNNSLAQGYYLGADFDRSLEFARQAEKLARKFDQKLGSKYSKEKLDRALLNKARISNK